MLWETPSYRCRFYLPTSCRSPTDAHYVCSSPFPVTKHTPHPGSHACYVSRDLDTPLGRLDPSGVIRLEQALARAYIYALARSLRGTSISDRLRHIFSGSSSKAPTTSVVFDAVMHKVCPGARGRRDLVAAVMRFLNMSTWQGEFPSTWKQLRNVVRNVEGSLRSLLL